MKHPLISIYIGGLVREYICQNKHMDSHYVEWITTCDNHYLICWSNCPSLTTESSINLAPILFRSLDSYWDVSYFWPKRISWTLFVLYLKLAAFPRRSGFYWWRRVFRNQEVGFACAHSQPSWEIWRDINMLMYPCPYLSLSKTLTSYVTSNSNPNSHSSVYCFL